MRYSKQLMTVFTSVVLATVLGCTSGVKKANIPSSANPQEEVARLKDDISMGYQQHYDVLIPGDFAKAEDHLAEAEKSMSRGAKQERILDHLRKARGYFDRARQRAESRYTRVEGVLESRKAALEAGARNSPKERKELKAIDDRLRSYSDNLEDLSPAMFADLQSRYMNLELASIMTAKLGKARGHIEGALRGGAEKLTPRTLKRAELDLRNAENMIAAHRADPEGYRDAVAKSEASAELLTAVLAAAKGPHGSVVDESVALNLVRKNRQISHLEDQLSEVSEQSDRLSEAVEVQGRHLQSNRSAVALQSALQEARREFSREEADVFEDNGSLLIRLKSVHFPTGRAEIPQEALPILAKVRSVAEDLNPKSVVVEGHTDSTGGQNVNATLSQKRAQTVADYLGTTGLQSERITAVGMGFAKPIANNKSPDGRAQNRRVDVIITPGDAPARTE